MTVATKPHLINDDIVYLEGKHNKECIEKKCGGSKQKNSQTIPLDQH